MTCIIIDNACAAPDLPDPGQFQRWAEAALRGADVEVAVRIVDEAESAALNQTYRHQPGPTNVLSFPFQVPEGVPHRLLGDLVICAAVVAREARAQGKRAEAHWAHLVVHGLLHLQGYDHAEESEAAVMEAEEIAILAGLGFPNPYEEVSRS
ncbi:rRNA maturation RNase YbeY [Candidatus Methylocalor cossyra]|uniref:Endoribonuclease YbeY n=1 Tax=Candidatus Methylocalor cossyra TaxID=3108543 RepID=A0ABP1C6E3_9GAMM